MLPRAIISALATALIVALFALSPQNLKAQLTATGVGGGFGAASGCGSGFPTITGIIGRYLACTGVTTSGGNVTNVTDQSGTSNAALTNTNGTVPFSASSSYNSKNAFAPNSAGVIGSASFAMTSTTTAAFCAPIIFSSTASTFVWAITILNGGAGNGNSAHQSSPGTVFADSAGDSVTVAASTKYRICIVTNGAAVTSGSCTSSNTGTNDSEVWLGTGASAMTCQAATNNNSFSFTNGSNSLILGGATTAGANLWSGTIPEVDVFQTHQLTATEIGNLDAYYQSNYGN
jgi:hypothetical protein